MRGSVTVTSPTIVVGGKTALGSSPLPSSIEPRLARPPYP